MEQGERPRRGDEADAGPPRPAKQKAMPSTRFELVTFEYNTRLAVGAEACGGGWWWVRLGRLGSGAMDGGNLRYLR